jgi:tetratricopeptide (TPR) repeat protein
VLVGLVVIGAGVVGVTVWCTTLVGRPERLVREGSWAQARAAADALETSVLRGLPGVADSARYTRALCLHLEGRYDASLVALRTVKPTPKMQYAILTLEAGNLVMLGRDAERALAALEEARKRHEWPEDLLLRALATLALGRRDDAEALFERAGERRPKKAPSPRINDPVFHFLRALFLLKTGRAGDAMADLVIVSKSPCPSAYVDRARALLPPEPGADLDPGSLGPQVLGE